MTPLQQALSDLEKKLSVASPLTIEVRRDFVLNDAIKEAGKKKFDATKKLKVIGHPCSNSISIIIMHL